GQLRGAVALDRERELVRGHAGAVVADRDQRLAALAQPDLDAGRAGIDRILDQFLDGRRRALDDLAGGDAVDDDGRQLADRHDGHFTPEQAVPTSLSQADRAGASGGVNLLLSFAR